MTAQRRVVIDAIAGELVRLDLGHPVRVAVDGITGAGKTTFASELAAAVGARGRSCLHVSMDGFHHPRAVRYRQGRESADGYYEDAYDFGALCRELLEPLGRSGDRRYRTAVIDLPTDSPSDAAPEHAADDLVVVVDGSFLQRAELNGAWDRVVYLAATFHQAEARGVARDARQHGSWEAAEHLFRKRYHPAQRRYLAEVDPEGRADVVVEHGDPMRPVVRSYRRSSPTPDQAVVDPHVAATQAFFASRAEGWNQRFDEDARGFVIAVDELAIAPGETVLDLGCGAGRALPDLTDATGPTGLVVGVDLTAEMLVAAREEMPEAVLILGQAERIPLADARCDAVLAAGLLSHLDDPLLGLVEIARVSRTGARLGVFHPVGRAALARKHGHELRADDPLEPVNLAPLLAASGHSLVDVDDGPDRYFALARRQAR